jgi:hypothetical protein
VGGRAFAIGDILGDVAVLHHQLARLRAVVFRIAQGLAGSVSRGRAS